MVAFPQRIAFKGKQISARYLEAYSGVGLSENSIGDFLIWSENKFQAEGGKGKHTNSDL